MVSHLESATMFVPGRASYIDEEGLLQLTEASRHRGEVADATFDPEFHYMALFAGGYPGLAQGWSEDLVPPKDRREAHLMAQPLKDRLAAQGYGKDVDLLVRTQGDSNNSIGDVILSVEQGLLIPDDFNSDNGHGIDLVAGFMHGLRFRRILARALDMDPDRIRRVPMRDTYGTPAYPHQSAESSAKAVAKECAGIALTELVLRDVKPGDINGLKDAEQRLISMIQKEQAA